MWEETLSLRVVRHWRWFLRDAMRSLFLDILGTHLDLVLEPALAVPVLSRGLGKQLCSLHGALTQGDSAGEQMKRQRDELSFSSNTNHTALNKNIATACKM